MPHIIRFSCYNHDLLSQDPYLDTEGLSMHSSGYLAAEDIEDWGCPTLFILGEAPWTSVEHWVDYAIDIDGHPHREYFTSIELANEFAAMIGPWFLAQGTHWGILA